MRLPGAGRPSGVRRGPLTVLMVLLVALVAAGCDGLPSTSPVQQGLAVGGQPAPPPQLQYDGPERGASPTDIVGGFIRAGGGFGDDHTAARQFLSSPSADWQPDVGVWVTDSQASMKLETLPDGSVQATAPVVAYIDDRGVYQDKPAGSLTQATFGMKKTADGWRISSTPKGFGVWLSSAELEGVFRPFAINYFSPVTSQQTAVPDFRWFPITAGLATTLARAQLDPVPSYLKGAVTNGIPQGTSLAVEAVPIDSGRAIVDLSATALGADAARRRLMWGQMVATLSQVPAVDSVALQVEGNALEIAGRQQAPASLGDLGFPVATDPSLSIALLRSGTVLRRVDPDRLGDNEMPDKAANPGGAALPAIPKGWISLAASRDGTELAAIGGDRADLGRWQNGVLYQLPKFGASFTRPSYDGQDGLWVAGEAGGQARVWVINTAAKPVAKGTPRAVPAPWLAGRTVVAFRVAPDNERAALITTNRTGGDVELDVTGIVRSADGTPQSLTSPLRVGWTLTAAQDVSWIDGQSLALIGRVGAADPLRPYVVDVGGRLTPLSPLTAKQGVPVRVTTTGGSRGIEVVTNQGQLFARAGQAWQAQGSGDDLIVPGA